MFPFRCAACLVQGRMEISINGCCIIRSLRAQHIWASRIRNLVCCPTPHRTTAGSVAPSRAELVAGIPSILSSVPCNADGEVGQTVSLVHFEGVIDRPMPHVLRSSRK